jgi:gamma-glutamylcyclotransferase (GGCT)/AIG2-like uncharacterized protein YtfP
MPKLFSYGTLQQENVQIETFGRRLEGQADALPGFRREMVRITDPEVIAASGSDQHPIVAASGDAADEVAGTVFDVTDQELASADDYEVDDYKRVAVRLRSGLDAWVYVKA